MSHKQLAIVGTTDSLLDAPYDSKDWEIWGLNGAYQAMKRYDKWFDLHDMKVLKECHKPEYFEFMTKAGKNLTLNKKYKDYPDAKVFPYKELVEKYGNYFTNTIAWLVAYAIEQSPEEIGIWGVNMATDTEYAKQRPCCEYYMGIAKGKGIKITVPEASELLQGAHLYGIEENNPIMLKMPSKERELRGNYNDVSNRLEDCTGRLNQINGYVTGHNELMNFLEGLKLQDEKISAFSLDALEQKKQEAMQVGNDRNALLDDKARYQGAIDLVQYFKVNWG